jgi:hypothetical protein
MTSEARSMVQVPWHIATGANVRPMGTKPNNISNRKKKKKKKKKKRSKENRCKASMT